jgi:hypothetical protein
MNEDCHRDDSAVFGWCRGKGPHPRSIDAAIVEWLTYGRECRLPNGIYRHNLPHHISRCLLNVIIDQGNLISVGARERADDLVEISGGEPRPDRTQLSLRRINGDGVLCCSRVSLLRVLSRDLPDLPRDRNRLKCIRGRESLQKLLNPCGLPVFDNHINLSLGL